MSLFFKRILTGAPKLSRVCSIYREKYKDVLSLRLADPEEYTETPEYPPILPMDKESIKRRELEAWYDIIKKIGTVEEKILGVNCPRYFGWKCYMLDDEAVPYDSIDFVKHITKTHVVSDEEFFPEYYKLHDDASNKLSKNLKSCIEDAVVYQIEANRGHLLSGKDDLTNEKVATRFIINELNRVLLRELEKTHEHLKECQIDYEPRIDASWVVKSMNEKPIRIQPPHGLPIDELAEEYLDRPSDKFLQYLGKPILQVRSDKPLPPILKEDEIDYESYPVEPYNYDPHYLGFGYARRHVTNIPGFWPGDPGEFCFLSYQDTNYLKRRPESFGEDDRRETLISQAITSSFGWLFPTACYQGFSPFHDITYPLVTQTVLSDGKEFTFAVYQLNTTELYHKDYNEIKKSNLCWITPTMKLFEGIKDGKLEGFNEDVLKYLIKFYINKPSLREGVDMTPYLNKEVKIIANYEDDEKREWLENHYKYLCQNKKRRLDLYYEVADWERIFKIEFRTMLREPRRRPFELRQQPYHKTLQETPREYIPRCIRPDKDLPKWRQQKWKQTYWPYWPYVRKKEV